jgi:uncharacterized repeat protein (TIGR02543 family)
VQVGNLSDVTIGRSATDVPQINGNRAFSSGGGISVGTNSVSVNVSGKTEIKNNTAGLVLATATGGGIGVTGGSLDISGDVVVSGNKTSGNGGGIYSAGTLSIVDATISNNSAQNGGGIFTNVNADTVISGTTVISDNTASGRAGGFDVGTYSHLTISGDVIIANNTAPSAGGLRLGSVATVDISGKAVITNNTATAGSGGGIDAYNGSASTIMNISDEVEISNNSAQTNGGGSNLYMPSTYTFTLNVSDSVLISGNTASDNGGGLYIPPANTADINISDTVSFVGNTASANGGAIWTAYKNLDKLNIASGVLFSNNSAAYSETVIAPIDLPTYNAHVFGTNWTTGFSEGYNNYDIAYSATRFTVSFEPNGGSPVSDILVYHGDLLFDAPDIITIRDGYRFLGWYYKDVNGDLIPWDFSTVLTGDLNLIAMWERLPGVPNTGLATGEGTGLNLLIAALCSAAMLAGFALARRKLRRQT